MAFNSTPQDIIEQNINGLLEMHRSWKRVPLALVSDVKNGFAFKSTLFNNQGEGERLIRIRDVLPGDTKTYYSGMVPDGYWVNPDDIVVGMDGDFNLACWQSRPALLNQRVCRLDVTSQSYIKRFFYRVLPGYIEAVNLNTSSTTVKHLSSKTLSELLIPLPPLAEQKVIADKLDTLLAQVENTKARLERIPQILKRFRQSVLAAAVSGRLTEEWRGTRELNGWANIRLGDLVQSIEAGKNLKCIETPPGENECGIIKISAVTWGVYDEEQSKTLPEKSLFLESRRIKVGDFLISRANTIELLGNPVIVHKVTKNLMLSDKVLRLNMRDEDKAWVNIFLRSMLGRKEIQDRSTGNQMSMRNIGQKALLEIPIPKPPYEEQTEIVRR